VAATANRWNLGTGSDLTAEPALPIAPVNLPPLDVATRLANRGSQPAIAPPAAPQGLYAMAVRDRSVLLYWDPVLAVSQWGPLNYNVYVANTLVAQVGGANHTYTLAKLTPATSYSITISAVGPGGESSKSSALSVTTLVAQTVPAIPPYAATGLVEIASAADGVLTLRWNSVGATPPVTSYKLYDGTTVKNTITAPTTTGTINVVPGAPFAVTVRAVNSAGDGPPSNPALTGIMPGAITIPAKITGQALNGSVTTTTIPVQWTADPRATSYKVYDGAVLKATVAAPATSTTLTGYTTGTAYSITIKGSNSIGDGTASNALTGSTA
jgi:hypothetical protein